MSRTLTAMNEALLVTAVVSPTRPSDVSHGVDITSWRTNGLFSPANAVVFVDGDDVMTISSPTDGANGVELWGYRLSRWSRIGYLNDGADVDIAGDGQGFAQPIGVVGVFERLAIAGTPSIGAAVADLAPIDTWTT